MKRMLMRGLMGVCVLALVGGCNTIRGAGQDIEQGGKAIQNAAS